MPILAVLVDAEFVVVGVFFVVVWNYDTAAEIRLRIDVPLMQ
jgi:hypothetical protein